MKDPFVYLPDATFLEREILNKEDHSEVVSIAISLPILSESGVYLCFVRSSINPEPHTSVMVGDDALGAIISALAFAKDEIDRSGKTWMFDGSSYNGGFPKMSAS